MNQQLDVQYSQVILKFSARTVFCPREHNFRCPLISPLSVDPLVNVTALNFHFENVNLIEERIFLNIFMASALKILFCRILKLNAFNANFFFVSCP